FLQQALALDDRRPDAWALVGMVHLLTGDNPGAVYYLEQAQMRDRQWRTGSLVALGQAYHLSGRSKEAMGVLDDLVKRAPNNELARVMRDAIRLAEEAQAPLFRVPSEFTPNVFRPENVQAAVNFPELEYVNTRHGFSVVYPYNWTL